MKTTAIFERRHPVDNQLQVSVPKGTEIEVEEVCNDMYEVVAMIPITKNHDNSIYVSKRELDSFTK